MPLKHSYTVTPDGCVAVENTFLVDKTLPLLPRLGVEARGPLEFSASHYTAQDLFTSTHTYDLKARPEVYLNLDCRHSGLGTASCGPGVLPPYTIKPGRYLWNYALRPGSGNDG